MNKQVSAWPAYVSYAYGEMGYEGYEAQARSFLRRWGGLGLETLVRVFKEGQGEDKLLATFALGYTKTPTAHELLLPLLQSSETLERYASALCLGNMREEQALPVLCETLTAFLPPQGQSESEAYERWLFDIWRVQAIMILTEWSRPEVIPQLFAALQSYWNLEQAIIARSHLSPAARDWRWCQGGVVYALGWLGAFDLPRTMDVGEQRLLAWNVYLALGDLHAHVGIPDVFTDFRAHIRKSRGFHDLVCHVLEIRLGLSEAEQEQCLNAYNAEF
jgi:hypothetical protein